MKTVLHSGEPSLRIPAKRLCNAAPLPDGDVLLQTESQVMRVAPDGSVKWKAQGQPYTRELVGPQEQVLLWSGDHYDRLELEHGQTIASHQAPPGAYGPEYGPDGELVFATSKSSAVRVEEGKEPQELRIASNGFTHFFRSKCPTTAAVAPDGSVLVFEAFDGVCRDRDGNVKWRHTFDDCLGEFAFHRGRWYFPNNSGGLQVLDPQSGQRLWSVGRRSPNACNVSAQCVTPGPPGVIYFHPRQSKLIALDEATGKQLFTYGRDAADPVQQTYYQYGAQLGQDGRLYVQAPGSSRLDVLDARTGQVVDTVSSCGQNPRLVGDWIVSEQDFQLRLDPLHDKDQVGEKCASGVEQRDGWLIVGGTALPKKS